MTIDEFKKLVPEKSYLEGNELWDAMEDYMVEDGSISDDKNIEYNIHEVHLVNPEETITLFVDKRIEDFYKQDNDEELEKAWKENIKNAEIISIDFSKFKP